MDSELKPCPFCGGTSALRMSAPQSGQEAGYVACSKHAGGCGASTGWQRGGREEIIAAWNRRA
ncbi:MAG: Lar family restriction alleviation protein [Candidatus Accumulibacter sp.]|jgi:Lar family restriction alleviation protein|nr:Lar family restriction alleviation protein [Accumulibacter sp.]